MCGRFVQIIDIELFVKRFGVEYPHNLKVTTSFNVALGDQALVITSDKPNQLQEMQFGLTPKWAKKQLFLINARAEGDMNPVNELSYSGHLGIVDKPSFSQAIQSQRCLVIANAFYEGPAKAKLNKPFKISKKNNEVFCFAGIWDRWTDPETNTHFNSFSIVTTVSNAATLSIGHPRSPVNMKKKDEHKWLNPQLPIEQVLKLLKPFDAEELQVEPVSIQIKDPKNKSEELLLLHVEKQTRFEF